METYKEIIGFDDIYSISDYGNVLNTKTGRILKQRKNNYGYLRIGLNKDGKKFHFLVHRLVLKAFNNIDNDHLFQGNHKNRIKTDNNLSNLEWCTQEGNQIHWREFLLNAVKKAVPF